MVKPIVLAIILSDIAIREQGTGKWSLIGTFNGICADSFPCTHPSLSVYISITEGRGRVQCKLRLVAMEDSSIVFDLPGQIDFGGPTNVLELAFQLKAIRFQKPGVYSIEFWIGSELLASRKLSIQKAEPQQPQQPPA